MPGEAHQHDDGPTRESLPVKAPPQAPNQRAAAWIKFVTSSDARSS